MISRLAYALDVLRVVWTMMSSHVETPDARVAWATSLALADTLEQVAPDLVVAVEWHESRFDPDAESLTDDHGLMQLHGRHDLCGIARAYDNVSRGIEMLAESARYCHRYPLAVYAVGPGGCTSELGVRLSLEITTIADRHMGVTPPLVALE